MGSALIWLLDDTPLGHLAQCVEPTGVGTWESGRLAVASTTADSTRGGTDRAPTKTSAFLDLKTGAGVPIVSECVVQHGGEDPAAEVLLQLHPDRGTTKNLAEREAIAWCLVHGVDTVLVTCDKRAALSALAELGRSRVAHPFDVWLDLLGLGWINDQQFEELCRLTRGKDQGLERMPGRIQVQFRDYQPTVAHPR